MRKLVLALGITAFGLTSQAMAEQIQIPVSQQGDTSMQIPQQGSSQQQVLASFGKPVKRHATVGQPPITRWDYQSFSVYFEHNTVINSVRHHGQDSAADAGQP